MKKTRPGNEQALDRLLKYIASIADDKGTWYLSADEVQRLLGVNLVDYARRIYASARRTRTLTEQTLLTANFTHENPEDLLTVLEILIGPEAEGILSQAGVFLPHEVRIEVMEAFLDSASEAVGRHAFQQEEFAAMLEKLRGYERARTTYLEYYFELSQIVDDAVMAFCWSHKFGIPAVGRASVERILGLFMQRNVLSADAVFAGLSERMYRQAVREGYIEPGRRHYAWEEKAGQTAEQTAETARIAGSRQVLGFAEGPLTLVALKSRYRELMKHFHPDVNPEGLRRSQEINAAYAVLVGNLAS